MSNSTSRSRKRIHAIVPRSLLAYAGAGLGLGIVPLSFVSAGCSDPQSIGIAPGVDFDADNDGSSSEASIGIRPAMDFDADNTDGQTSDASIGIRPAMDFDADTDASSATDAGDSSAPSDASGDAHTTS